MSKILIATDSWHPLINGVVTSFVYTTKELERKGHEVRLIHPGMFKTFPMPFYPEVKLSLGTGAVKDYIEEFDPDNIHIVTEGPIGRAARAYCLKNTISFTTSLHTKFPEFIKAVIPFFPLWFGYWLLKRFHAPAKYTLVPTESVKKELEEKGFEKVEVWSRGIDTELFSPKLRDKKSNETVWAYVGRVSKEKRIEDFLDLELPGIKKVVGDGPDLERLKLKYKNNKNIRFLGYRKGKELAKEYACSDVMVFPSKSDTFGNVIIESMSCGTPVAAYPVTGPIDIIKNGLNGHMHENLQEACILALKCNRSSTRLHVENNYDWEVATNQFIKFVLNDRPACETKAVS